MHRVDHIRGLSVRVSNVGGRDPLIQVVELCPEARLYSYTFEGTWRGEALPAVGLEWARLELQDSALRLWDESQCLRADLPGLVWPAFARLVVAPDVVAVLHLTYGSCRYGAS